MLKAMLNNTICVMTKQKIEEGIKRPHYGKKEGLKIQKEFQIGLHSDARFCCRGCSVKPSRTIELQLCGGCSDAWFCGSACLKKSWSGGHKRECGGRAQLVLPFSSKATVDEGVTETGFCLGFRLADEPHVICLDASSGKYFESFSDKDVVFHHM